MDLLKESGLDFNRHKTDGIPHALFGEYLITSGLVLNKNNHWITFQGGVDFGYLLKSITNEKLPSTQDLYLEKLKDYFTNFYDCRELMKELVGIQGGLTKVSK